MGAVTILTISMFGLWGKNAHKSDYEMKGLTELLFGRRQSRFRWFAIAPALVALLFVGHAWEDGGAVSGLFYPAIIVVCIVYVLRPMFILWLPVFLAFLAYAVAIALSPQNGPTFEWVFFMLLGFVPAILLWLARPGKLLQDDEVLKS